MLSPILIWSLARIWGSLAHFIYVFVYEDVLGGDFFIPFYEHSWIFIIRYVL